MSDSLLTESIRFALARICQESHDGKWKPTGLMTASRLAGFFTAEAIISLSGGEPPQATYCFVEHDGEYGSSLIPREDACHVVHTGRKLLTSNEVNASDAVFLFNSTLMMHSDEKVDAIIIEMKAYAPNGTNAVIGIPYTPKRLGKFRVYNAVLLRWPNAKREFKFFQGVSDHDRGLPIWDKHLDPYRFRNTA